MCLSSSKVRAALKKQHKNVSWIGAEDPSSSRHSEKVFNKDGIPSQIQKIRT
jgi:hypothetical protein